MGKIDTYVKLAERPNTRRSYASAVQHFEAVGRGSLPATSQAIAAYLADYAGMLSINTLRNRLAGLSRWHQDHGYIDPTKSPLVSRVLKGIRSAHNTQEKQARPIEFDLLEKVSIWLESELDRTASSDPGYLRLARDRAMLLIGFWRGFRSDELTRLRFENVTIEDGVGMSCFLPFSKGDRDSTGQVFFCPVLSRLCPVTAFEQWRAAAGLTTGPVFRGIDQWGHVSDRGMNAGSVVPWIRKLFQAAGVADAAAYSSHSLRRGFANWARSSGWDIKELMQYVGWRDFNAALRYLEISEEDLSARFEHGLAKAPASKPPRSDLGKPPDRTADSPRNLLPSPASNVVTLRRRSSE